MKRLANGILVAGAAICLLGAAGALYGAWVHLPPAAVRMIALSLPFVVGGVLLVVGALVGRAARRVDAGARATAQLGEGAARDVTAAPRRQRERAD